MLSLFKRAINKYQRDGMLPVFKISLRLIKNRIRQLTIDNLQYLLWKQGIIDIDDIYPESYFIGMDSERGREDAEEFCTVLMRMYDPERVIDLGCGIGRFLKPFDDHGIEVYGVDGSKNAIQHALIDDDYIDQHDLTNPFDPPNGPADIALCIEVMEHLPEESSETIVKSIARSAPIAVISAAPPGQRGRHHVNTKPPSFWEEKFRSVNMELDEEATKKLRSNIDPDDLGWLSTNTAVFITMKRK